MLSFHSPIHCSCPLQIPDFASVTSLTSDPIFFNGYYFNLQFLRTGRLFLLLPVCSVLTTLAPKDEKSGVGVYLRLDVLFAFIVRRWLLTA